MSRTTGIYVQAAVDSNLPSVSAPDEAALNALLNAVLDSSTLYGVGADEAKMCLRDLHAATVMLRCLKPTPTPYVSQPTPPLPCPMCC